MTSKAPSFAGPHTLYIFFKWYLNYLQDTPMMKTSGDHSCGLWIMRLHKVMIRDTQFSTLLFKFRV